MGFLSTFALDLIKGVSSETHPSKIKDLSLEEEVLEKEEQSVYGYSP